QLPVNAIARQADGKLVVAGDFSSIRGVARLRVARLNANGSLDTTFRIATGPNGGPNGEVNDLVIQPDGKIVITGLFTRVAGVNREGIARLNRNGTLDTTFLASAISGANTIQGEAVALQADGKILVGGLIYSDYEALFPGGFASGLWRLNQDGTFDSSFNIGTGSHLSGLITNLARIYSIAVQPDGKVLTGGTFTAFNQVDANRFIRLNSDGSVDSSWVSNMGSGANDVVRSILVQNNGRIVFGGDFTSFSGAARNYVGRSLGSGAIDAGFNAFLPSTYGGSNKDIVWSTAMQADGKLLLALDSYGEDQSAVRRVFSGINQVAGRVEFTSGSYSGIEEGNVTIDVQRVGGSAGAVSVSYSTYAGTAVEGTDYPLTTGVLNWGNGDTSTKSIVIAIPNDGLVEPNENFIIQLGTPLGGTWLGETAQALVSIDDAPTATIDPESMTVTSAAQSYPIDVTSSASWTPLESADWVTVNPPSGSGNGTVTVTVAQNPATSQRSTVISIGGRSHVLTQEGAAPFVAIDPASHTVDSTAQPYQIDVTSNTDWTVTESLDWVSVDLGGGSGDETLTVSVLANPSASPRSGDIDIGGQTHHLTQQGATPYTVPQPLSKTVDHEAQSYTF
ncbi:MAG: hypothetical protein KDM63_17375, partial [Verrucomicrobiae bacterium]|nr:hypothetical protein [Verrucomicrobiae bacterium]